MIAARSAGVVGAVASTRAGGGYCGRFCNRGRCCGRGRNDCCQVGRSCWRWCGRINRRQGVGAVRAGSTTGAGATKVGSTTGAGVGSATGVGVGAARSAPRSEQGGRGNDLIYRDAGAGVGAAGVGAASVGSMAGCGRSRHRLRNSSGRGRWAGVGTDGSVYVPPSAVVYCNVPSGITCCPVTCLLNT
jgi:hypothetical protein